MPRSYTEAATWESASLDSRNDVRQRLKRLRLVVRSGARTCMQSCLRSGEFGLAASRVPAVASENTLSLDHR